MKLRIMIALCSMNHTHSICGLRRHVPQHTPDKEFKRNASLIEVARWLHSFWKRFSPDYVPHRIVQRPDMLAQRHLAPMGGKMAMAGARCAKMSKTAMGA